jgi:hypothetical protein
MDLNYTPEDLAFRDQVRSYLEANLPTDLQQKVLNHKRLSRRFCPLAQDTGETRLGRYRLAERIRRYRLDADATSYFRGRMRAQARRRSCHSA